MIEVSAVMIGLLQGNMASGKHSSTSRGWWRLTASVFAIVGATLAFGYYLPLRQANQLLEAEFEKARRSETALSQQLNTVRAELSKATEERDALSEARSKTDAVARESQNKIESIVAGMPAAARTAAQSNRIKLTPSQSSLVIDVLDKTWITPGGDALTRNGHRVICPALSTLGRAVTVNVRAFVSPVPPSGESRWAAPGRLAAGVAETLIERCKLDTSSIRVVTAGATPNGADAPLLQLELLVP